MALAGGDGFLVVPAGELDLRRVLGEVDDGEVVVGAAVFGVELDGFAEGGLGGGALAFLAEGDAEEVLDLGVLDRRAHV